jgi:cyclopropane-fatty-acyl-phospholipid synthase
MSSLAEIFGLLVDGRPPISFRGYDGTVIWVPDSLATVEVRSPDAISHLLRSPGQLGVARAYVTGAIEVDGELHAALGALLEHRRRLAPADMARLLRAIPRAGLRAPTVPTEEAPARWRRGLVKHTRLRDEAAIAHHYDLSNRFYELVLGPSMAYSCAVFTSRDATLEEAQAEKFDLICRKLRLRPGQRLLDVGAGWGGMVIHAAANYGVSAVGVTLSRAQAELAQRRIEAAGLARRVEVQLLDYRDVREGGFDAISSIGAMEHFGTRHLGPYFSAMATRLRPGGRMLNHCITRPSNHEGNRAGPFLDRYIFPDGELQGPGTVISAMHDHGLELRHAESLREHYGYTLREWGANLERNWDAAVGEVGEQRARAWRLYMAASRLGFEWGDAQIHQVLGVRTGAGGNTGMPLRPDWDHRDEPAVHVNGDHSLELAETATSRESGDGNRAPTRVPSSQVLRSSALASSARRAPSPMSSRS